MQKLFLLFVKQESLEAVERVKAEKVLTVYMKTEVNITYMFILLSTQCFTNIGNGVSYAASVKNIINGLNRVCLSIPLLEY